MTPQEHTLIGAYALHAVDEAERVVVERHVTECESCATELREFRATAARLADFTMIEPPSRLREEVLSEIRRTRQATPRQSTAAEVLRPRRIGSWRRTMVAVAVVLVIALATGLVTFSVMQDRLDRQQTELAQMEAVLTAEDARFTRQAAEGGGEVSMILSRELDQAVVVLSALQGLPDTQAYQLWLVEGDEPTSVGVLDAGHSSAMHLVVDIGEAEVLGVTAEPAGGSATPTLPMVAGLPLQLIRQLLRGFEPINPKKSPIRPIRNAGWAEFLV